MSTLIKNGTIVTSSDEYRADILVEGEKIAAIGNGLENRAETATDATGRYIFPGGIDGHTHFNTFAQGARTAGFETTPGAIVGGTTCVVDFAPQPKGMSLVDAIAKHREESAEGKSVVDFGLHATVQDSQEGIFSELGALVKAGVPTMKVFMAYKGLPNYSSDDVIFRLLQKSKEESMLVLVHAEHADMIDILQKQMVAAGQTAPKYHAESRPPDTEREATFRATMLAKVARAPIFIVHVSCAEALDTVQEAKRQGIRVFAETCPHYLILNMEKLASPGAEGEKYICSPPLRESWHHDRLWTGLQNGWLQVVGSDHCGFSFKDKNEVGGGNFMKIPNGCPGVQFRLAILYTYGVLTGKLSLQRMVDVFATAPAKCHGLYPRKGSLVVGSDADLVIFDPKYKGRISVQSSLEGVDFTPFEGLDQKGRVEKVFLRGKLSVDEGKFIGETGQGKFIEREPSRLAYSDLYSR